jgi:hypothetical protein
VAAVPFGFGHRKDREQPAVGERRPAAAEDPRVAFAEDFPRLGGQLVAGLSFVPPRLEYAASSRISAAIGSQPWSDLP